MRGFHFHFFFETWVVDNQDISDWKNKQTILTRYVLQNCRPRCHSHTTPPYLRLSKPNETQRHGVHCRTRRLLFCFVSCANLPEKWWSRSFGSDSPGQRGSASPPPLYPPTTGAATSSSVASGRSDTEETILRQTRVICEGLWRRGRGGGGLGAGAPEIPFMGRRAQFEQSGGWSAVDTARRGGAQASCHQVTQGQQ